MREKCEEIMWKGKVNENLDDKNRTLNAHMNKISLCLLFDRVGQGRLVMLNWPVEWYGKENEILRSYGY
ncbi:hypothetical protein GCM10007877_29070 [Marinibactrum halimedae]|uniref:Uncharacterized protein n=1 Tax=Marinibactrum halimedae TaxID=1444977 RepID=A0AA37T4T8_9GAMM|nr:hypothetical protein GCM10007877_29070 [Marinibactrum halimedae]